jgi:lipoprotein-releasing system permease protein
MNPLVPFEWIAAIRFLREGRMQTIFIAIAVAIGVAVIVFMSALLTSLQSNFLQRVLTSQPHIQLVPPQEAARPQRTALPGQVIAATVQPPVQRIRSIDQWQQIETLLVSWPGITTVSPTVTAAALATRGSASRSISLTGIEPDTYFSIVSVPDYIVRGTSNLLTSDILIGTDLATALGVALGDKIIVSSAFGGSTLLTITGIFDLGNKGANERVAYVALRTAQALSGLVGGVTSLDVTVADAYAAEDIAQRIQAATGVEADSWIATNAQFFTAVNAQQTSNTMIRVFVGLSVAFGIASVLVVTVIQRSKDIGILRAMGTSQGKILRVFLLQGGLLGFLGSLLGTAIWIGGVVMWHAILRRPDGTEVFPLILEPSLSVYAVVLASVTGIAAAAVPAIRAARLDPVVAIRG